MSMAVCDTGGTVAKVWILISHGKLPRSEILAFLRDVDRPGLVLNSFQKKKKVSIFAYSQPRESARNRQNRSKSHGKWNALKNNVELCKYFSLY